MSRMTPHEHILDVTTSPGQDRIRLDYTEPLPYALGQRSHRHPHRLGLAEPVERHLAHLTATLEAAWRLLAERLDLNPPASSPIATQT